MTVGNFYFLKEKWPILSDLGSLAEEYLYDDPNTAFIKLRIFGEKVIEYIFAYDNLEVPGEDNQFNKLRILEREEIVNGELLDIFHSLRKNGNRAVHESYDSIDDAKILLSLAYKVGSWFIRVYGDDDYQGKFNIPVQTTENREIITNNISENYEKKLQRLEDELENIRQENKNLKAIKIRKQKTKEFIDKIDLTPGENSRLIEDMSDYLFNEFDTERKFITTVPFDNDKENPAEIVWDNVRNSFRDRQCIGYWRYPIYSSRGQTRKEPDILIADQDSGIIILYILKASIKQIEEINGDEWVYGDDYQKNSESPIITAEEQLYTALSFCDSKRKLFRKISGKIAIVLSNISSQEWADKFKKTNLPLVFSDQMGKKALINNLKNIEILVKGQKIEDEMWKLLLLALTGQDTYQSQEENGEKNRKTRNGIKTLIKENLYQVDMQQDEIAKTVPPGPQRIRGIAGSGKSVLLCQKAAHMHLKYPDWDIAVVFFTRSLYDNMTREIDKWIRHYSNGEKQLDTDSKLQILHAWGAREQPGFYRKVCLHNKVTPLTAGDRVLGRGAPSDKLVKACKLLLEEKKALKSIFNAVLIDEAQDLVVDNKNLKYHDKQPFFWLAYQSLKSVKDTDERRLIWAYDEAQSLNSLNIPTAPELFGKEDKFKRMVSGFHKGGIRKSEVMNKCYRTPGPILVAAHAIGMGILREEGMLNGFTTQEDWENIGYQIKEGSFRSGQKVKLHRPEETTPNMVPRLWNDEVIEFNIFNRRQQELKMLARNIKYNLAIDNLNPSRDILIIVPGFFRDADKLQKEIAKYLLRENIDVYLPGALKNNDLYSHYPNNDPDRFWNKGGVTISKVFKAKGNEAYMVYVVGLDNIAENEADFSLRNQLFVALTRTKGWLNVSGIGSYHFYDEFRNVLKSGNTFRFKFQRPLVESYKK